MAETVGLQPFHRQVYRGAVLDAVQLRLRRGDRPHLRNDALRIVVQADTQVHLVRARVLFEFFHQRQNGIAGIGVNVLEHGGFSPGLFIVVWAQRYVPNIDGKPHSVLAFSRHRQ